MSRILLLFLFLLWMTGSADPSTRPPGDLWPDTVLFLGFYALLVGALGLWSRLLARRVAGGNFHRSLARFNQTMLIARLIVPAWFGLGMFVLGWGWVVREGLKLDALVSIKLPSLLVGTLPPIATWIGLWWSQYPAERALREQHLLSQLEDGLPLHAPPDFKSYFLSNLRLQVLFTLVPVLMIVLFRDLAGLVLNGWSPAGDSRYAHGESPAEFLTFLLSAGIVFLVAPEVLRRVLNTSPLPDSPLRRRLEAMCRRTGMKYRDILVWHTHFNMGNAAVMGIVPQMRYIMLSDLLLERMDDDQIEAVFAHEVGHVVHRHMVWYLVFFVTLSVVLGAVDEAAVVQSWMSHLAVPSAVLQPIQLVAAAGGFWVIFGYLSRRFERQADVYAARMMEMVRATPPLSTLLRDAPVRPAEASSFVGPYGAQLFASALRRVAVINNIPVSPRSRRVVGPLQRIGYFVGSFLDLAHDWLHGSIPHRMAYLQGLSVDPSLTSRFDRVMTRLYCAMLFALCASVAWLVLVR